jgi:hypothetical protein
MSHRIASPSCFLLLGAAGLAIAGQGPEPGNFERLHRQIKPQAGEARWMELPWLIDLHQARQKAAAEGKPLFVMSGGGATAIGPC